MPVVFASGGIASAVVVGGIISLVAISTAVLLIQGYMKYKDLDHKIRSCQYAYQSYQHVFNAIRDAMRSSDFRRESILNVTQCNTM